MINSFTENDKNLRAETLNLWTDNFCQMINNAKRNHIFEINDIDYVYMCKNLFFEKKEEGYIF